MGTRIGEIQRVVVDPKQRLHAVAKIDERFKDWIRRDSVVSLYSVPSWGGGGYIEIGRGVGPALDWDYAVVAATLPQQSPNSSAAEQYSNLVEEFMVILEPLQKATVKLDRLLGDLQQNAAASPVAVGGNAQDLEVALRAIKTFAVEGMPQWERKMEAAPFLYETSQGNEAILTSVQVITRTLAAVGAKARRLSGSSMPLAEPMVALLQAAETTTLSVQQLLNRWYRAWEGAGGSR